MSRYVTPFLVLNLGSEMIFVVAQRLQAQNITQERAALVLEEIISALVSKQLITELIKPQSAYNHENIRDIIEDITQSSVMRLDSVSMSKLWDLISMVFKWQVTMSEDLIALTQRHLYEIENYVTNTEIHLQLQKVQTIVDNFNKILDKKEKMDLLDSTAFWLKDYNVRVSLLIRMGLQGMDGNFIINNLDPIAEEMLRNLGENIYMVTNNGRILENRPQTRKNSEVNELQLFVDEMMGSRKLSTGSNDGTFLKLTINDENITNNNAQVDSNFDNINVKVNENNLHSLINELNVCDDAEEKSFQEDLLEMIGQNTED
ncbi:unnamed protein product [Brassicogethes aeneus]|uniref:Uncharacterized protein n=1 Tax=Brassicogethes aeneus TaxID=1431903 RepID=A0A9P0FNE4_BRAAE|nr:unnamed protein product [Brassicogethes aeneus]